MAGNSFYLGPRRPRLQADSWDDVVSAAVAGVLDETQWVELKQAVPPSSKPANLELAKDLASLSVDGGVLIVGITDAGGAAGEVIGTDLTGLETRVAQVSTGRVSPPLSVALDVIGKPDEPGTGLLLVTVPASEAAPHMVDGQYWGRGAQGKRVLADDEVRRLLADRQARARGFSERLRALPSRLDPPDLGHRGRLYLLLEPGAASEPPLTDLLTGRQALEVIVPALGFEPRWSPAFTSLGYRVPHPDGLAAASMPPDAASTGDQDFLTVLLADDGSVHVSAPAAVVRSLQGQLQEVLSPVQLLETMHAAIRVAGHLAQTYTGYQGPWRVGALATQLRGLLPIQVFTVNAQRSPYPGDEYVSTTETTTRSMLESTPAVVEALAKRLLRGVGMDGWFLPYEEPAELVRRIP